MMQTYQPVLTTSITAAEELDKPHRYIGFDGKYCAAGDKPLGVLEATTANGEQAPVNVLGVILVEAAGVVAAAAELGSDADGRAVAGSGGGYALDGATAAGEVIRVVRGI